MLGRGRLLFGCRLCGDETVSAEVDSSGIDAGGGFGVPFEHDVVKTPGKAGDGAGSAVGGVVGVAEELAVDVDRGLKGLGNEGDGDGFWGAEVEEGQGCAGRGKGGQGEPAAAMGSARG